MRDLAVLLLVLAALAVLLGTLSAARRRGLLSPEATRKSVHVGLGIACALFPWLFSQDWPVFALAGAACTALAAVRLVPALSARFGRALGDVRRRSWGEFHFALGVALVWWLSGGEPSRYCLPVLVLALADAAGALVGTRFGRRRYSTDDGAKSWEGSLAFLATATAASAVALALAGERDPLRLAASATLIGGLTMVVEAVAWRGLDNLALPPAVWAQLSVHEGLDTTGLLVRLGAIAALVGIVIARQHRTRLNDSGLLAAGLALYILGSAGGLGWAAPAAALVVLYHALHRLWPLEARDPHGGLVVAAVALPPLLLLLAARAGILGGTPALAAAAGAVAGAAGIIVLAHGWPRPGNRAVLLPGAALAGAVALAAAPFSPPHDPLRWLAAGVASATLSVAAFAAGAGNRPTLPATESRWWLQGLAGALGAPAALLLLR